MDIYKIFRAFWDFAFDNPEKIKPIHVAIFAFAVEHCNRLGWKEKFGFPSQMAMEAIGIHSYNTYISGLNDLVNFGLITMIQKSKNQYSSNIIALSNFDKAHSKALDKALSKHSAKQLQSSDESTHESNCSIDIQYTNLPITNNQFTGVAQNLFPKFNENFGKKWQTWLSHLTEKGKSPTIGQMQEQISFLNQYSQSMAEQIISNSLNGGYTALYKPKDTQVPNGIGKRPDGLKKTR